MSLDQFRPQEVVDDLRQEMEGRMMERNIPANEIGMMSDFLSRMAEVASQLIFQEKEIHIPNTDQRVPYNLETAKQALWLFCEGMFDGLLKSWEIGTPDELRAQFLQNVAQYVYENAKQVVVSTYGQENTPGFEIEESQQVQMVTQTAESALLFFINEYEKTNGPIENIDRSGAAASSPMMTPMDPDPEPLPATSDLEDLLGIGEAATPEVVTPPIQTQQTAPRKAPQTPPAPSTSSNPKEERFAALALFLNTLSQAQRRSMLAQFNPQQQEMIEFYSVPENIERRLYLPAVIQQLNALKRHFKSLLAADPASNSQKKLKQLIQTQSPQALLQAVQSERSHIQQVLEQWVHPPAASTHLPTETLLPFETAQPESKTPIAIPLPPRIETVLSQYLSKQFST